MSAWNIVALLFVGMALADVAYLARGLWKDRVRARHLRHSIAAFDDWHRRFNAALAKDGATYEPVTHAVFHADGFAEDADAFCISHGLEVPGDITWVRHP